MGNTIYSRLETIRQSKFSTFSYRGMNSSKQLERVRVTRVCSRWVRVLLNTLSRTCPPQVSIHFGPSGHMRLDPPTTCRGRDKETSEEERQ